MEYSRIDPWHRLTRHSLPVPQRSSMPHPQVRRYSSHVTNRITQPEQDRLDMQHAIFKALFMQRNWFAPLKRPKRVLDIGCGTGKWCMEMGMFVALEQFFGIY